MTSAAILLHDTVPYARQTHLCIQTRRGVFVGVGAGYQHNPSHALNAITTWHPVPRWMTPLETLRAFAAP